jgi:microcystin-dependent protein
MDPFVAEIRILPCNFAPKGWAFCNGQLLPLSQNTALFSLLGTVYGGDGKSTFALPDLRGNAPMHKGQGTGLSPRSLGEIGGAETVTLLQSEMPVHTHNLQASGADATTITASGNMPALGAYDNGQQNGAIGAYSEQASSNTQMGFQAISPVGGNQPHNNMQPYLTLNFCIALQGVYPPRS